MRKYKFLFLVIALAISAVAVAAIRAGKEKAPEPAVEQKNPQTPVQMATLGTNNSATAKTDLAGKGNGLAALEQASQENKYLFIYFYDGDNEKNGASRKTFESIMDTMADEATWVAVNKNAPTEKQIVEKLQVQTAPMPLIVAIAPNGAITGGFAPGQEITEESLRRVIVTPGLQKCLKALQERKIVFLCAQNKKTKFNDAAMRGVNDFKSDSRFAQLTEIVTIDPADKIEEKFIAQLKIDPNTDGAITAFLAPPGTIIGKYEGSTNKEMLLASLQQAMASCGSGCGPQGCAPQK